MYDQMSDGDKTEKITDEMFDDLLKTGKENIYSLSSFDLFGSAQNLQMVERLDR